MMRTHALLLIIIYELCMPVLTIDDDSNFNITEPTSKIIIMTFAMNIIIEI